MRHALVLELQLELKQSLGVGLEDDSVSAWIQVTCGRLARCVRDLCSEETSGEVGTDNDVVGDRVVPKGLAVNLA
jgi:hypothetical protein